MKKLLLSASLFLLSFAFCVSAADSEPAKPVQLEKAADAAKPEAKDSKSADADAKERADDTTAADDSSPGVSRGNWDTCLPAKSVVSDLEKRESVLNEKEKTLAAKEADLKAREAAIGDEVKKLDQMRKDIQGLKAQRRQKNEEQVAKLIETVEKMSPKSAAPLLAKVDEDLAVATMQGLSTDKLAKIMANMDINRSIRLSELLAMGENAPVHEATSKETAKGDANGSSHP
jgi:flagellar motility protein MotE (MotC chaperone)